MGATIRGSNCIEVVLQIPQSFETEASPLVSYQDIR